MTRDAEAQATIRVTLAQMRSGIALAPNIEAIAAAAASARAAGAQMLATPEMSLRLDRDRSRLRANLACGADTEALQEIARIARLNGLYLLLGSAALPGPAGRLVNRSILFGPDGGARAHYDKIHLFDVALPNGQIYRESDLYAPGAQAVTAAIGSATIGLSICYDVRFGELYRALALAGAGAIFVPSAFTRPTGEAHWRTLLAARAIETGAYVLAPAQGGVHEDGRETWGHTMAFDPWGRLIGLLDHDEPGLLTLDLALAACEQARAAIPAWAALRPFDAPGPLS